MRQTIDLLLALLLTGLLFGGCSLLGLYGGPPFPGPPLGTNDGSATFLLYNAKGQRVGTVHAVPTR
jgi:hypothetical protein